MDNQTSYESGSAYNDAEALFLTVEQSIVSALGIVANLIILSTMPFARMNKRIRLILTALAFADLGAVVLNGLLNSALTSIVPLFTGQSFMMSSMNQSACLSTQFLADFFEASVQWITAFLTAERFYVVYFPFRAAQLRFRTAVTLVIATFIVCFLATSPHFAYYAITASGGSCVSANTDPVTATTYFIIRHLVFEHVLAPGIILLCNTLVLIRLAMRKNMHVSAANEKSQGKEKSKLKMTITLVVVSTIHISGFIPCGIFCFIYNSFADTPYANETYQDAVIAYATYGIMHFINFIIYVCSMEAYRDVLMNPPVWKYTPKARR